MILLRICFRSLVYFLCVGIPILKIGLSYTHKWVISGVILLKCFARKQKIALTGARSRVRESLAKRLIQYFLICTFYFNLLISL